MRWHWWAAAVSVLLVAVVVAVVLPGRSAPRLEAVPANQAPAPPLPSPDGPASPQPVPTSTASASPSGAPSSDAPTTDTPSSDAPSPDAPSPDADEVEAVPLNSLGCEGSDRLVVSSGEVEAALGHRYLVLGVSNCTDEPFDLPARPDLSVRDATGSAVGTTFLPDEHSPTTATELAPGTSAYLQLHWLVAPLSSQPTAGHQLVLRLHPTLTATKTTQLDADGLTEVDVHDWAPTVSEAVDQ